MKTIRCKLTKTCRIFANFTESFYSLWVYFLKFFKKFHRFIEELYARLYHWYVRSIEFVSILRGLVKNNEPYLITFESSKMDINLDDISL